MGQERIIKSSTENIPSPEGHNPNVKEANVQARPKESELTESKEYLIDILNERLGRKFALTEYANIIDRVISEGSSAYLSKQLSEYTEKLGSKRIIEHNRTREILINLGECLFGFLERIIKKGEITEQYTKIIKEKYDAINDYLRLLSEHSTFERLELGTEKGFLHGKLPKEVDELKLNGLDYIAYAKKILEKQ